jgi:fumarate hydratase subunit beta
MKKITVPFSDGDLRKLKAGDEVLLSGTVYTARDAVHKRIADMIEAGKELPFDLNGLVIYYTGPTPARPGRALGSCGPTSAYRMDKYMPVLAARGLKATIGKGPRSDAAKTAMKNHGVVYFAATGGAGALLSKCVEKAEVIAFEELGCEAVRKLRVKNFPLIVINDLSGRDFYHLTKK